MAPKKAAAKKPAKKKVAAPAPSPVAVPEVVATMPAAVETPTNTEGSNN